MKYSSSLMRSSSKISGQMDKNKKLLIILKMMLIAIRILSSARINTIGIILRKRIWRGRIEKKILHSKREMLQEKNLSINNHRLTILALKV